MIDRRILTENDCYREGRPLTPRGVMVHSTGADNPRLSRYIGPDDGRLGTPSAQNWNRSGVNACVHGFIGKLADGTVAVYQTLPWTMRGWHAGGSANNTHIGFELCEDDLSDESYFRAVYHQAVELTAFLCRSFQLDPLADGVVICHSEGHRRGIASNHADVMHWFPKFGKDMDQFRREVAERMSETGGYAQWLAFMERYRRELAANKAAMPDLLGEAVDLGLTDGSRPGDFATREECAVMARAAAKKQ